MSSKDPHSILGEHPAKDIQGTYSHILTGKTICMCLTGSVAVITAPNIARDLIRHGAEVICVMSKEACDLIQPELLEWATGNKVITDITGAIEHIALAGERPNQKGKADLILVCPATANTISKIACGIDDTPPTTVCTVAFGSKTPIIIVPAMHESMYHHPILLDNINKLKGLGVQFIEPRIQENKAKIATPEEISEFVRNVLTRTDVLANVNILITAGPSREFIDRVRFISNPSSGKMGIAFAEELLNRGAKVTVILGPSAVKPLIGANIIPVTSAEDFARVAKEEVSARHYDILISAAAIGDFMPVQKEEKKISSDEGDLVVHLKRTPKLLETVRKADPNIFIVAFKAETDLDEKHLIEKAHSRLQSAAANMIIANNVADSNTGRGFNTDTNEVFVINPDKSVVHLNFASKREIARQAVDLILKSWKK
jgi:phosphopantothenoylcysteine decarboxylase/phosphopantothenate--cysteine ligase